jgi:flagellin-like protein
MKGISPIIASVLLIAITMSIAVVLAAYVTSYTREQTEAIPSACIGGALFIEGDPTCAGDVLTVSVEGQFVTLNNFEVEVRDASSKTFVETVTPTGITSLAPGDFGTLTATLSAGECTSANEIRVTTNCFNVKTAWEQIS